MDCAAAGVSLAILDYIRLRYETSQTCFAALLTDHFRDGAVPTGALCFRILEPSALAASFACPFSEGRGALGVGRRGVHEWGSAAT